MAVSDGPPQNAQADAPRVRRVLLVEDEAILRAFMRRNLERRGVAVMEAGTVGEALALSTADRPDLIVLDIDLPDRSGWDFLRELRAVESLPPTIVTSAGRVARERLPEFGLTAFLPKPFAIEELVELVTTEASGVLNGRRPSPPALSGRPASSVPRSE